MPDHAPAGPCQGPLSALSAVAALLLAACATAPSPPPPAVPSTAPAPSPSGMPSSAGRSAAVPLDSVDVQPTLINVPVVRQTLERNFPPRLRDTGRSGTVGMSFRVDEEGVPSEFHVVRSSGYPDMDAAAIKVAEAMRFTPATKGGSPVSARVQMPITFRSQEGSSWRQE